MMRVSAVALLAIALNAHAGVYKCQDANGKLSFTDRPCQADQELVEHKMTPSELREQKRKAELLERSKRLSEELSKWAQTDSKSKVYNSAWDGSVRPVEKYLNEILKDPDSFEAIEWGPVWTKSGQEYRVRCKYRAKNSFGGYVVAHQVFIMNSQGWVVRAVDYNGKHVAFH